MSVLETAQLLFSWGARKERLSINALRKTRPSRLPRRNIGELDGVSAA